MDDSSHRADEIFAAIEETRRTDTRRRVTRHGDELIHLQRARISRIPSTLLNWNYFFSWRRVLVRKLVESRRQHHFLEMKKDSRLSNLRKQLETADGIICWMWHTCWTTCSPTSVKHSNWIEAIISKAMVMDMVGKSELVIVTWR